MLDLFAKVKESAKKAFAGQEVKLRQEFLIGVNSPNDLGSILDRARTVTAAAKDTENAAALKGKGWVESDTTDLEDTIKQVGDIDKEQQKNQNMAITGTDARNTAANALYEGLQTIQNAADIEWSTKKGENRRSRESFRLGNFPPAATSAGGGKSASGPAPSPAPSPAPPPKPA